MRRDRGAQVVEFALIVPLVLILIGAIVQFGFAFNRQVTVTQAAREGARLAAICGSTCSPKSVIQATKDAAPGLDPTKMTITVQYCPADGSACTGSVGSPGYCPANADQDTGDAVVIISYPSPIGEPLVSFGLKVHGKAHMPCGG
jgi:Flp pilus assembly protein TadG